MAAIAPQLTFEGPFVPVPPGTRNGSGPNTGSASHDGTSVVEEDSNYQVLGFLAWQEHDWYDFLSKHDGLLNHKWFPGNKVPLRASEALAVFDGALNANLNSSFSMATGPTNWFLLKIEVSAAAWDFLHSIGLVMNINDASGAPKGKSLAWSLNAKYPADGFKFSFQKVTCGALGTELWIQKHLHFLPYPNHAFQLCGMNGHQCTRTALLWSKWLYSHDGTKTEKVGCSNCQHAEMRAYQRYSLFSW
jgi:hypothetical protein